MPDMTTSDTIESRLAAAGLVLPDLVAPRGNFQPCTLAGDMLYLSGKGLPTRDAGTVPVPKVGGQVSVAQARAHAHDIALYQLAVVRQALGDLQRIVQVVKVFGMVNAVPDFTEHTEVVNGFSDLWVQLLGERGRHARSAIGVGSLPMGFSVEIEAVLRFR